MIAILLTLFYSSHATSAQTLDGLLNKIQRESVSQSKELKKRENQFKKRKNRQRQLLDQARKELEKLEKKTELLSESFEANQTELAEMRGRLETASGTMGELFGVVRQTAAELRGQFESSVISAEIPGRSEFISDLAERKSLPTSSELERLWFEIQREMTEAGKVSTFQAEVIQPDGSKVSQQVTRVGSFNLVANGSYLDFDPSTQDIVQFTRQPRSRYLSPLSDFETETGILPFAIDPSRGALLSVIVQSPSWSERLKQGGAIGYIILALLGIGLLIVVERFYILSSERKKIFRQIEDEEIRTDNALGLVFAAYEEHSQRDLETLELKMDEALLKVSPKIERGISTLKVLAAIAPLLGLLGTVTGMISTFQAITLFGTGDPKLMAGGISTALITTVLGLICAIPLLLLHNIVSSQSQSLLQVLEEQTAGRLAQRALKKTEAQHG